LAAEVALLLCSDISLLVKFLKYWLAKKADEFISRLAMQVVVEVARLWSIHLPQLHFLLQVVVGVPHSRPLVTAIAVVVLAQMQQPTTQHLELLAAAVLPEVLQVEADSQMDHGAAVVAVVSQEMV
jgi:hypothetical protein